MSVSATSATLHGRGGIRPFDLDQMIESEFEFPMVSVPARLTMTSYNSRRERHAYGEGQCPRREEAVEHAALMSLVALVLFGSTVSS